MSPVSTTHIDNSSSRKIAEEKKTVNYGFPSNIKSFSLTTENIKSINSESLKKAIEIANSVKISMNNEYLLPNQFITFPVNQEKPNIGEAHVLPIYNSNLESKTATIKTDKHENLLNNTKKDNSAMQVNKSINSEINIQKDFRLNRSASRFSNLILELKSIHEKSTRYLKNKFNNSNNEKYCVSFKNGIVNITDKATIARQELIEQHQKAHHTNDIYDFIYSPQIQKSDLYNNYKILLDEINRVESKLNKLIINDSKGNDNKINPFQYHNKFKNAKIIDMIDSLTSSNNNLEKIKFFFGEMKEIIRLLEDKYSSLNKVIENNIKNQNSKRNIRVKLLNRREEMAPNEQALIDNHKKPPLNQEILLSGSQTKSKYAELNESLNQRKIEIDSILNSYSPNEKPGFQDKTLSFSNQSLNSDSSGYISGKTDESGDSSEETENRNVINNNIDQKNHELENPKLKKTEAPHTKTHITVKPEKTTYPFNGKIYINRATMLRDMHISKEYNFQLNENSKQKVLNNEKPDTKKLDSLIKASAETANDLSHLQAKIKQEEAHSTAIKNLLNNLGQSAKA